MKNVVFALDPFRKVRIVLKWCDSLVDWVGGSCFTKNITLHTFFHIYLLIASNNLFCASALTFVVQPCNLPVEMVCTANFLSFLTIWYGIVYYWWRFVYRSRIGLLYLWYKGGITAEGSFATRLMNRSSGRQGGWGIKKTLTEHSNLAPLISSVVV